MSCWKVVSAVKYSNRIKDLTPESGGKVWLQLFFFSFFPLVQVLLQLMNLSTRERTRVEKVRFVVLKAMENEVVLFFILFRARYLCVSLNKRIVKMVFYGNKELSFPENIPVSVLTQIRFHFLTTGSTTNST